MAGRQQWVGNFEMLPGTEAMVPDDELDGREGTDRQLDPCRTAVTKGDK